MTAEEALMLFPRNTGEEAVIADEESILALRNLEQIKEQIKNLEAQAEAAKAIIQQAIGENSALIDTDGTTLVTWKNNKDGQKTDWKKTEDDLKGWAINTLLQPELVEGIRSIIDSNTQKTKGARPFIIK
jgi:predicted lipoprotein with Yx(FWY)xxD motif